MSDFESMRKKHRRDSMLTLSFFLFLLLVFVFHTQYLSAFRDLVQDPDKFADVLKKSWLVLVLTLIGPFVSYFLGIFTIAKRDLYYTVDNFVFRRRKKVDRLICESMLDFNIELTGHDKERLSKLKRLLDEEEKRRQIMAVFYRYIEKGDVVNPALKEHAFIYWGDYFSSMMFVVWGALALLGVAVVAALDRSMTGLRLAIVAVMAISVGFNLVEILRGTTAREQFEIPKTQISEIHRSAAESVLNELRTEGFFLNGDQHS